MRVYYEQSRIGSAKYVVNFHDGAKTYRDGSPFYDIAIFSNKRKCAAFVACLVREGYTEEMHGFSATHVLTR